MVAGNARPSRPEIKNGRCSTEPLQDPKPERGDEAEEGNPEGNGGNDLGSKPTALSGSEQSFAGSHGSANVGNGAADYLVSEPRNEGSFMNVAP